MMARGDSIGVFQFESEGMREALKKVGPDEFEDLVALNALYRPGAMDQIPTYARGKRNPDTITYVDERLRPITEPTKGVILYQEQSMQIAKSIAGFSGPRADDLRKAIGKKNRADMAKLQPMFIEGCRASGTSEDVIEWLWTVNERSADYSFNRSHAACYGLIAYRTAWLKANYPAEYMAALISSVMDTKDKVPFFVNQTESMGIEILPPDVNKSDHEFMVVDGNISFGLDAVKGVGYAAVEAIKRARDEGGPFTSLWDFCERVDARAVNKRAIEALIKCGAFGSTGATRRGMLDVLEAAQGAGQKTQLDAQIGQGSIFDLGGLGGDAANGNGAFAPAHPPIPTHEYERQELLAIEKESIGLFITEHPLKRVREALRMKADCTCAQVIDAEGRRLGEGRRHDHRVEEDPHAHRHADDVRHRRRPRRQRRDRRVREDAGGGRATARCRRDRADPRPRRPQGGREELHHRPGRRALPALRRRDREGQGAGRPDRRERRFRPTCGCASTPPACSRR